jgi:hypothetical protein
MECSRFACSKLRRKAGRAHRDEFIVEQVIQLDVGPFPHTMPDGAVSSFEPDVVGSRYRRDFKIHVGMLCIKTAQARHQPADGKAWRYFQPQAFFESSICRVFERIVQSIKGIGDAVSESFAHCGKFNFAPGFTEQLYPQSALELLDLLTDSTRRHVKCFCSPRDALGAAHRVKDPQRTEKRAEFLHEQKYALPVAATASTLHAIRRNALA